MVTYVEKYIPELIPRMLPVHSPMMCTAIYMKKYMNVTDELEYGLGSLYPMPGGLRENVEHFLGKEQIVRQVEGEHEAYHYLREYAGRIKQHKQEPFMVDILNCSRGCIYGTATDPGRNTNDVMLTLAKMRNSISNTAEYGDYRTGKRLITEDTRKEMQQVLKEIQDGTFASEFLTEMSPKGGRKTHFLAQRRIAANHPIEKVGAELRKMMSWLKK